MRIIAKEITKGLDGNDSARDCILLRDNGLEKQFQRGPRTSAQFREESSVIEVIPPQDFGYAEDEMSVRDGLEDILTKPLTKFNDPLLMARWTEVTAPAWKCKQILMAAIATSYPSKAIVEGTTVKISANHLFYVRSKKTVLSWKPLIIDLLKRLKMIFNTPIILR